MARRGKNEDVVIVPAKRAVVAQYGGHRDVIGDGIEIIPDIVEMKDTPVTPEVFSVREEISFMSRNGYRNGTFRGLVVALALVSVVMSMENPFDLADPESRKGVQDLT